MTKLFPRILCSPPLLRGACIAAVLACAGGCGQKGALYLPAGSAADGHATLDQVLIPFRSPTSLPSPATDTVPTQRPPLPTPQGATGGGGTGTAAPVERP